MRAVAALALVLALAHDPGRGGGASASAAPSVSSAAASCASVVDRARSYGRTPDLLALRLGSDRSALERCLASAGLAPRVANEREMRLQTPVLERLVQVQRVQLTFDGNRRLREITLQVLAPPGTSGEGLVRLFDEVRSELRRRLGRPSWDHNTGIAMRGDELGALWRGDLVCRAGWEGPPPVLAEIPRRLARDTAVEVRVSNEAAPRDP